MKPNSKEIFLYLFIGALLMLLAHLLLYLLGWVGEQTQSMMPGYLFLYPVIYSVAASLLAHHERWVRRLTYILMAPVYYWLWNYLQSYERQLEHPFILQSINMFYVVGITVVFSFAIGYIRRRSLTKSDNKEGSNE